MTQCKGTTKSGNQCKLDAQPDSEFCHLHGGAEGDAHPPEGESACLDFELEDLMPILLAGAMLVGMFVTAKTLGRWLPR